MRFAATADAYDRFMGRYSVHLAPSFADFADVSPGQRVLDVGCGPGALTTELVKRLGTSLVAAVDPAEQFVAAARERHPGVEVRVAAAERLPFSDGEFDAALAQLVVHFMEHPVRGLAEMARVTRDGGVVAACVWDHAGKQSPLAPFWDAVHELDPTAPDESRLAGGHQGHLTELFDRGGPDRRRGGSAARPRRARRRSRSGGSHSPSASALRVRTSPRSTAIVRPPYGLAAWPCSGSGPFTIQARVWAARGYVGRS